MSIESISRTPIVRIRDAAIKNLYIKRDDMTGLGTGGMTTKLAAAKLVTGHGTVMIICSGADPDLLYDICEGKPVGTRFRGA